MTNFIASVSLNNFDAIMTAFFRNIGMIDSTSELSIKDVIVDVEDESVMMEAEKTNESIQ
jgi:hypothetical protein